MLTLVVNNKFNDYGIHESKLSILFYKFVLQYIILKLGNAPARLACQPRLGLRPHSRHGKYSLRSFTIFDSKVIFIKIFLKIAK